MDTEASYIIDLKTLGVKIINFEDLGSGALKADLVINAIYPEKKMLPNHYFRHDYFILRDEFILTEPIIVAKLVMRKKINYSRIKSSKILIDANYNIMKLFINQLP